MKRKKKIFLKALLIFIIMLIIACVSFIIYTNATMNKEIDIGLIRTGASSVTNIYYYERDENGQRTEKAIKSESDAIFLERSEWCSIYDMPTSLSNAFIAIEDKHFFEHKGVDWLRTSKAFANYIFKFDKSGYGGSTITQQLIKNLTGDNKATPKRKIEEIFRAINLEKKLGKNEILESYLNVVYLSENCYGVSTASELYFGKKVKDLTIAECATLSAIVKNPSKYDPYKNPEENAKRRRIVLSQMYSEGMITEKEYNDALSEEVKINSDIEEKRTSGIYSWFTEALIDEVSKDLMETYGLSKEGAVMMITKGGLNIYSTEDPNIQNYAENVYRSYQAYIKSSNGKFPESACVVMDPYSSEILAIVGGVGNKSANRIFNRATDAKRAPGSTIKPLSVYAPALENGIISYSSVYDDAPVDFIDERAWPKNSPNVYRGLMPASYALAHSVNTVSIRVLRDLGIENSYYFLKDRFGLTLDKNDMSEAPLGLGQLTNGESLVSMCNSYCVFQNEGYRNSATTYVKVTDNYGNIILSNEKEEEKILSCETASIINQMLKNVVKEGTGKNIQLKETFDVAAKTGTSSNSCDKWFIGYTPYYLCGVWVGFDTPAEIKYAQNPASVIFDSVMSYAHKEKDGSKTLFMSDNIIECEFCFDSGKLPCEECLLDPRLNRIVKGYFVSGTEPREKCDLHKSITIDASTGYIADENTPFIMQRKIALPDYIRNKILPETEIRDENYLYSSRLRSS